MLSDRADQFVACLGKVGIPVERFEDRGGGWRIEMGTLDSPTFDLLTSSCRRSGGEPTIEPITRKELGALYDLNLAAKTCLEARGVTVTKPPTRRRWIQDSQRSVNGPWSPFDSNPAAFDNIGACPQPDVYDIYDIDLYGFR